MRSPFLAFLCAALLLFGLTACGKRPKGLAPPAGGEAFPQQYPNAGSDACRAPFHCTK